MPQAAQPVTLFIGEDSDSQQAKKVVEDAGFVMFVIDPRDDETDFETPVLISEWGIFNGLSGITWFIDFARSRYA